MAFSTTRRRFDSSSILHSPHHGGHQAPRVGLAEGHLAEDQLPALDVAQHRAQVATHGLDMHGVADTAGQVTQVLSWHTGDVSPEQTCK